MINNNNELYGIGHHLRERSSLPHSGRLDSTVEMYMHLNAINVGTDAGSIITATLASGGVCPLNYKKVHLSCNKTTTLINETNRFKMVRTRYKFVFLA